MTRVPPEVLLLAPLCHDEVIVGGSRIERAGGSGLFAATALKRLGARVRLHASLARGDEGLFRSLPAEGILFTPHPSRETTRFEIEMDRKDPNARRIIRRAASDPLDAARIDARGCIYVLVAPLLPSDLDSGLIDFLAGCDLPVDLGVQGLCRRIGPDGSISIAPPAPLRLPSLRIVAGDEDEIASIPDEIRRRAAEIVTTHGDRGASIAIRGTIPQEIEIPAILARGGAREAIGLGDTFLAVYGWMRTMGIDPRGAGDEAARAATALLEEGLP